MKNAINYYYNLVSYDIHQANRNYFFTVENSKYALYECNIDIKDLEEIYQLSMRLIYNKFPYHQIILNNQNQFLTVINNINYILLKINCENFEINLNDILKTNITINENTTRLNRKEWFYLWSNKIDFLEYQYNENKETIKETKYNFNYYIGMAETAILLSKDIKNGTKGICHRRLNYKDSLVELYNPLNLVIDYKVRDACEYFKSKFFSEGFDYNEVIFYINTLNFNDIYIFFTRLLFPSYYFDIFENIIEKKEIEKQKNKINLKAEEYELFLKSIYIYIKQLININEIEWLTKNVG